MHFCRFKAQYAVRIDCVSKFWKADIFEKSWYKNISGKVSSTVISYRHFSREPTFENSYTAVCISGFSGCVYSIFLRQLSLFLFKCYYYFLDWTWNYSKFLMKRTACCSALQRVAVCSAVLHLRCVAVFRMCTFQLAFVRFGIRLLAWNSKRTTQRSQKSLQHAATRCNTLTHAATRCNKLQQASSRGTARALLNVFKSHCNTLKNTLQHTAAHGNTQQHTATHGNTRQHTATHYNTTQFSNVSSSIIVCTQSVFPQWLCLHVSTSEYVCFNCCIYMYIYIYVIYIYVRKCAYTYTYIYTHIL